MKSENKKLNEILKAVQAKNAEIKADKIYQAYMKKEGIVMIPLHDQSYKEVNE